MKNKWFHLYFVAFLFVLQFAYYNFKVHFSGAQEKEIIISMLQEELGEQKLKVAIAQYELNSYQQYVATVLDQSGIKNEYQGRNIASISSRPMENHLDYIKPQNLFNEAKSAFKQKKYDAAIQRFEKLVEEYPSSAHTIESYFLIVESHYKTRNFEQSLTAIDSMVKQFPDSDLTGYSLLRMGQIFQKKNRVEDARDIFKSVKGSFESSQLKLQAEMLLDASKL